MTRKRSNCRKQKTAHCCEKRKTGVQCIRSLRARVCQESKGTCIPVVSTRLVCRPVRDFEQLLVAPESGSEPFKEYTRDQEEKPLLPDLILEPDMFKRALSRREYVCHLPIRA